MDQLLGLPLGQEQKTHCTLYFLQVRSKSIHVQGGTCNDKMNTRLDVILWASLRSNNQFKCWQTKWERTRKFRQLRLSEQLPRPQRVNGSSRANSCLRFILPWPWNPPQEEQAIAQNSFCLTSLFSSLHPTSFKACLKCTCRTMKKKKSSSSLKWHKIAKTTRWERWWSCLKENWNN